MFVIPERSKVGYLDAEIAGEGQKVIMSDGEVVTYHEPPPKPVMPDISGIKSLKRYFNRTGYSPWPAWLYHPTEAARLVKDAQEAMELGVCYRKTTDDERARYGIKDTWDWQEGSQWRSQPYSVAKFDPKNPGAGKTYVASAPNPTIAQHELVRELVPLVAAAVTQAMQAGGKVAAPGTADAKEWQEFLEFQAWKKSQAAVEGVSESTGGNLLGAGAGIAADREALEQRAAQLGVKVDGRWTIDRVRREVEAAEKAAA